VFGQKENNFNQTVANYILLLYLSVVKISLIKPFKTMETAFLLPKNLSSSTAAVIVGLVLVVLITACLLVKWISNQELKIIKQFESTSTSPQNHFIDNQRGKITASHKVKLFDDIELLGIQSASINEDDPNWITVTHHTEQLTLSIENWKHLVVLTNSILPTEKGGY